MTAAPVYPTKDILLEAHRRLLARYGGVAGVQDGGAIEAALARAEHIRAYGEKVEVVDLAAAVAYSITRIRHPFVDGNKRVGFATLLMILELNGHYLDATELEAWRVMDAVAGAESEAMDEETFRNWVAAHTHPL